MVALPDLPRDFTAPPVSFQETVPDYNAAFLDAGLRRVVCLAMAVVFLGAAAALWLLSHGTGEAGELMIRLLLSATLCALAWLCLGTGRPVCTDPDIHVDTGKRQLRVVHYAGDGHVRHVAVHPFDSLSDLSLHDGLLTARDGRGRLIVALPLPDRVSERRLRRLLSATG